MMKVFVVAIACFSTLVSGKYVSHAHNPSVPFVPVDNGYQVNEATFDQLIDHNNPQLGTFQQRYWWSTEFWEGSGYPVIVFNPGEVPVTGGAGGADFTGYLGIQTLTGQYAYATGGAGIVIEHRFWGTSSPYTNLTAENLKYLTVDQAVKDMTYFAENAVLPFDRSGKSNAPKAPWVLVGGSYSGALAAWTEISAPGTYWAYHASSAPVQAIEDYWQYFVPIQEGIAKNCSNDFQAVIAYVDYVLGGSNTTAISDLKTMFNLATVEHAADFAAQLKDPLNLWQDGIPYFLPFCDALEGISPSNETLPTAAGVGLDKALANFATWFVAQGDGCGNYPDCWDSYNSQDYWYHQTTLDPTVLAGRQWQWMLCNEALGFWQTGAPQGVNETLVSRTITADYYQQQCAFYFPDATFTLSEDAHNTKFGGWNIPDSTRLMFSNGEFDPWKSAGVSSEFRPGGPVASTDSMPVFIVPDGIHVQDIFMNSPTPEIISLRSQEISVMSSWVFQFYNQSSTASTLSLPTTAAATATLPSAAATTSVAPVGVYDTDLGPANSTSSVFSGSPQSSSSLPVSTTSGVLPSSNSSSPGPTSTGVGGVTSTATVATSVSQSGSSSASASASAVVSANAASRSVVSGSVILGAGLLVAVLFCFDGSIMICNGW